MYQGPAAFAATGRSSRQILIAVNVAVFVLGVDDRRRQRGRGQQPKLQLTAGWSRQGTFDWTRPGSTASPRASGTGSSPPASSTTASSTSPSTCTRSGSSAADRAGRPAAGGSAPCTSCRSRRLPRRHDPRPDALTVGASGAIFGLMGRSGARTGPAASAPQQPRPLAVLGHQPAAHLRRRRHLGRRPHRRPDRRLPRRASSSSSSPSSQRPRALPAGPGAGRPRGRLRRHGPGGSGRRPPTSCSRRGSRRACRVRRGSAFDPGPETAQVAGHTASSPAADHARRPGRPATRGTAAARSTSGGVPPRADGREREPAAAR